MILCIGNWCICNFLYSVSCIGRRKGHHSLQDWCY
jgi:hypothetical protein